MDKVVEDYLLKNLTDIQSFGTNTGTYYIIGNHGEDKYSVSKKYDYILIINNKYVTVGACPSELLETCDAIMNKRPFRVSSKTMVISKITGYPVWDTKT